MAVLLRFGPAALPAVFVHDVRDCGPFSGGTKNLRAVEELIAREPLLRDHYRMCRGPPADFVARYMDLVAEDGRRGVRSPDLAVPFDPDRQAGEGVFVCGGREINAPSESMRSLYRNGYVNMAYFLPKT